MSPPIALLLGPLLYQETKWQALSSLATLKVSSSLAENKNHRLTENLPNLGIQDWNTRRLPQGPPRRRIWRHLINL